ncbi:hypothetical protein M9458_051887, partial [Cirrhinus mrigala]
EAEDTQTFATRLSSSEQTFTSGTFACVFQAKDLQHFRVPDLRTLGAPGDQHPTALHLQGCRNGFLLLSPLGRSRCHRTAHQPQRT